jgi:hypothetical protein
LRPTRPDLAFSVSLAPSQGVTAVFLFLQLSHMQTFVLLSCTRQAEPGPSYPATGYEHMRLKQRLADLDVLATHAIMLTVREGEKENNSWKLL